MLSPSTLPAVQRAIGDAGVDGWLLYDFRGCNPVAQTMAGVRGNITRRFLVWVPAEGRPVALTHAIEQQIWHKWPNEFGKEVYSSWRSLEAHLAVLVKGKRVAMEYSPGNAVPPVDRVPAGAVDMVRSAGAEVMTSGDLITRFYALWTDDQLAAHRRAAEHVGRIAREAFKHAGERLHAGHPVAEHELQSWIVDAFTRADLETAEPPHVAAGANAADPHYAPSGQHAHKIGAGSVLLIDLWAREPGTPYADQTWMGVMGTPSDRVVEIWNAVRDARDAGIFAARERAASGIPSRGGEIDDASRAVIEQRGFGAYFTHRTGHSIDARDIHGAGPNIDNLETREERMLIPGVGFSIEPGIYFSGEVGVRSEVNAYYGEGELIVTPHDIQTELIVV